MRLARDEVAPPASGPPHVTCLRLERLPPADAYGVASFYAMFSTTPRPPAVAHVCDDIACRVNGVTKQDSNTKFLYFKLPRLIVDLSMGQTLEAGDIISTGTPQGVGFARTPPEFMQPGDLLETEIEGIGTLRNPIGS